MWSSAHFDMPQKLSIRSKIKRKENLTEKQKKVPGSCNAWVHPCNTLAVLQLRNVKCNVWDKWSGKAMTPGGGVHRDAC